MRWQFWKWLFIGLNDEPGYCLLVNRWSLLHLAVGEILSVVVSISLYEAAEAIMLPVAGIFIGLSFAWAGNAQALLQDTAIEDMTKYHSDGIETYIYTFQFAILIILVTLILWGLAGLRIFELNIFNSWFIQYLIKTLLYTMAGLTLRECWHIVLGSQGMILMRHKIRQSLPKHS